MKTFVIAITAFSILCFVAFTAESQARPDPKAFKYIVDAHSKAPKHQHRNFADIASSGALIATGLSRPASGSAGVGSASATPGGDSTTLELTNIQSEVTVAVNGSNVVIGSNDFRGGSSFCGYAYSSNGGATFTDGGQLPTKAADPNDSLSGDPDIKVWEDPGSGTVYFIYSYIYFPDPGLSSLGVSVSTNGGATWSEPRDVTPANATNTAGAFADKEYISVDEETGRLFISWSSFKTNGTIEMALAYSDDLGLTWSPRITIANRTFASIFDGQGTITRPDRNSDNVYIAWRTFGLVAPFGNGISFARSFDNGATWSAPINVTVNVPSPEAAFGFDRVNGNPALAVDAFDGTVYMGFVHKGYKPRNADDHGDLYLVRSKNFGKTWSTPRHIAGDAQGRNRTQMFPWISTDPVTGAVDVIWFDQRRGTGVSDLTEVYHVHSMDHGVNYTCPQALTLSPFASEHGNNFSAPHQGDYIQSDSLDGTLYGAYSASPQFSNSLSNIIRKVPAHLDGLMDYEVNRSDQDPGAGTNVGTILVNGVAGGVVDPGTTMSLIVNLKSVCDSSFDVVPATLTSLSPDATVTSGDSDYAPLKNSAFSPNLTPFVVDVDSGAVPGSFLDFEVSYDSDERGPGTARFRLIVGTASVGSAFVSEDFEGVTPPALPAGWSYVNVAGASNPWVSVASAGNPGKAAFVVDLSTNSFDRLQSPTFSLPGGTADFYDIEFDTNYSFETDTARTGFDGGSLELNLDGSGSLFSSGLAIEFDNRYTHRINRSAGASSGDRSGWSGNSGGYKHVRIRISSRNTSGVLLSTLRFRFDMTSDSSVGDTGWFVDNITIKPVDFVDPTP